MLSALLVSTLLSTTFGAPPAEQTPASDPAALLRAQAKDWNRGDLEAFCAIYAEDATFVSPSGVTRGRAKILARYTAKYDTPEKRGRLSFDIVETRKSADSASVMLRWRIDKAKGHAEGHSLVVMQRTEAGWRIVQDASM